MYEHKQYDTKNLRGAVKRGNTDEAIQILGGMGLMNELPLERFWRDTRVDRIWDGTSEIQRHIISRAMLRPLGG